MRQRLYLRLLRKAGFSSRVSPRALISRFPMAGSFAHMGIRPQTKKSAVFWSSFGMTITGWVGAILKRGANFCGKLYALKVSCSWAGSTVKVNRPHMVTPYVKIRFLGHVWQRDMKRLFTA